MLQLVLLSLLVVVNALQLPNLQPFFAAITPLFDDLTSATVSNATQLELLKRQSNGCPSGWNNCAGLGAAGLCCNPNAVCSADMLGHVACCPSGVACTGTIGGIITGGTVDGSGNVVGTGTTAPVTATAASTTTGFQGATTTTNGVVTASTTTATTTSGNGFIIAGSGTVATPAAAVRRADIVSGFNA